MRWWVDVGVEMCRRVLEVWESWSREVVECVVEGDCGVFELVDVWVWGVEMVGEGRG